MVRGSLKPAKQALRARIWALLTRRRLGRFPFPLDDRIPNFRGAEAAAARLTTLPEWASARRLKCNPDAAQLPVRRAALAAGKQVFMAVPRLSAAKCFLRLDPARLRGRVAQAATIGGAAKLGEPVGPEALSHIDLIVAGSVAVDVRGARLGKGGGYSDLEFALALAHGAIDDDTLIVTTVHDAQVVQSGIPMTSHDVPVDVVATPTRLIRTRRAWPRPAGIRWEELTEEQLAVMPALAALRGGLHPGGRLDSWPIRTKPVPPAATPSRTTTPASSSRVRCTTSAAPPARRRGPRRRASRAGTEE